MDGGRLSPCWLRTRGTVAGLAVAVGAVFTVGVFQLAAGPHPERSPSLDRGAPTPFGLLDPRSLEPLSMRLDPSIASPGETIAVRLEGPGAAHAARDPYALLEEWPSGAECEAVVVLNADGFPGFTAGGQHGVPLARAVGAILRFRLPLDTAPGCYRVRHGVYELGVEGGVLLLHVLARSADGVDARSGHLSCDGGPDRPPIDGP